MDEVDRVKVGVDLLVVADGRFGWAESVTKQGRDERVSIDRRRLRPVRRIEVSIHEEFGEGEESEDDVIRKHFPAWLICNGGRDFLEILRGIELFPSVVFSETRHG